MLSPTTLHVNDVCDNEPGPSGCEEHLQWKSGCLAQLCTFLPVSYVVAIMLRSVVIIDLLTSVCLVVTLVSFMLVSLALPEKRTVTCHQLLQAVSLDLSFPAVGKLLLVLHVLVQTHGAPTTM